MTTATGRSAWFDEAYPPLVEGRAAPPGSVGRAIVALVEPDADPVEGAAFLTALRVRGETSADIVEAARALRARMVRLRRPEGVPCVDTCGTGGDGTGTFNVSTAAALAVAGAGVAVVKHGNRAVSSRSGSADVLRALGVPIQNGPAWAQQCLDDFGFAFCYAPDYHPALANVAPLRRRLGVRTIFNLLGPLLNPAEPPFQLIGVGRPELHATLAEAAGALLSGRAAVVCGGAGLDEVSLSGPTAVRVVGGGRTDVLEWTPADFGLPESSLADLAADSPEESAAIIRDVLRGGTGPAADAVVANAGAALWVAGVAASVREGADRARDSLASGRAARVLALLTGGA